MRVDDRIIEVFTEIEGEMGGRVVLHAEAIAEYVDAPLETVRSELIAMQERDQVTLRNGWFGLTERVRRAVS